MRRASLPGADVPLCRLQVHGRARTANAEEAERFFGLTLLGELAPDQAYDCVVGAVSHDDYAAFDGETLTALVKPGGLVVDLKGMWRDVALGADIKQMEF